MRRQDFVGLALVAITLAGVVAYRLGFIEPRAWGDYCAASSTSPACLIRAGVLWLQVKYLWGAAALALGLFGFAWGGGFAAQLAAICVGIAAVEFYNASWGMVGAALGAWGWLFRFGHADSAPGKPLGQNEPAQSQHNRA